MNKYFDYNIIPIGDHCAISMILKELKLRNKSYPFDWVSHTDPLYNTNIINNIQLINELNQSDTVDDIVNKYIGDAFNNNKINSTTDIMFPHDVGDITNIFEKYKRRFIRLKLDLKQKNIFILLTRNYYIEEDIFQQIKEQLLNYNSESIILFISGQNHIYFENMNCEKIIFKYIKYDISQFYSYDYTNFRPNIKKFISDLLLYPT